MKRKERRQQPPGSYQIAPPFDELVDAVTARDREWFKHHPGTRHYLRRYVPGELYPLNPTDAEWIYVQQIAPGIRRRAVVKECCELPIPPPGAKVYGRDGRELTILSWSEVDRSPCPPPSQV